MAEQGYLESLESNWIPGPAHTHRAALTPAPRSLRAATRTPVGPERVPMPRTVVRLATTFRSGGARPTGPGPASRPWRHGEHRPRAPPAPPAPPRMASLRSWVGPGRRTQGTRDPRAAGAVDTDGRTVERRGHGRDGPHDAARGP